MEMKTQLLCTFTKRNRLNEAIDIIVSCNEILYDKVYVFANQDDEHQLICTYNVEYSEDYVENVQDTISLHRKKQSNTLYTINALNEVIRSKNNGILDKKFIVEWDDYRNTLLLTNDAGLFKIRTRIYSIIDVNTWNTDKK
jgi:hypothetical protein|tara:strand:- start:572 stop:994 length:423 start_codon:yes stop_codon:yes gene_type:complete